MALTKTEKELLSQIAKKPTVLKTASATTLKKKEFIKEAVAINPKAIKYADEEILKDYTFLLKLVSGNGMVAAYIPAKYTNTHMFLKAIENTLEIEPFIPKRVYKDMADGMGIWEEKPYIKCRSLSQSYLHFHDNLISNKNMAIFISRHFMAGFDKRIPKKYRSDKDVAMAAVRTLAHNFYYIDTVLRSDMDIIKCAYRNDPTAFVKDMNIYSAFFTTKQDNLLKPFRSTLVNDREFIKDCLLSCDVCVLEPEYSDDEEIALLAMKSAIEKTVGDWHDAHEKNYVILSDRLKLDDRIIRMELENNGQSLSYMPDSVKDNETYARLALSNTVYAASFISERLMSDKSFVMEMLNKYDGHDFFYILNKIDVELLMCRDILDLATGKDMSHIKGVWFGGISEELYDFVIQLAEIITENPAHPHNKDLLEHLPNVFCEDEWVATACIVNNPAMYNYAGRELKNNPHFVLSIMQEYDVDISDYLTDEVRLNKEVAAYLKQKALKEKLGL